MKNITHKEEIKQPRIKTEMNGKVVIQAESTSGTL